MCTAFQNINNNKEKVNFMVLNYANTNLYTLDNHLSLLKIVLSIRDDFGTNHILGKVTYRPTNTIKLKQSF